MFKSIHLILNCHCFRYDISTRNLVIDSTTAAIKVNRNQNPFDYDLIPEETVTVGIHK